MARIAGVNLPNNKRIVIGLTYIHGIGRTRSDKIIAELGIDPNIRVADLPSSDEAKIREMIDTTFKVEGDLRREVSSNIKRLKEISTYRGDRHSKKLPLRGQKTKTNARTKRGKKATVGSGRKKAAAKT